MEAPEAPPMEEDAPDGEITEAEAEGEAEPQPEKTEAPPEEAPGKIVYSQPKRSPSGDAAFSRTEAAIRSVQAAARPPEAAELPAGTDDAKAGKDTAGTDSAPNGKPELPRQAAQLFSKTEQVVRTLVRGNPPPPPKPVRGADVTSTHTAADLSALENESYDLDDILAEFRDS